MVRLMLVLAPVMCILSGVAVSSTLNTYMRQVDPAKNVDKKAKKMENNFVLKSEVCTVLTGFLTHQAVGSIQADLYIQCVVIIVGMLQEIQFHLYDQTT